MTERLSPDKGLVPGSAREAEFEQRKRQVALRCATELAVSFQDPVPPGLPRDVVHRWVAEDYRFLLRLLEDPDE